ncbi:hypothetical protein FisN_29Hu019 [Fistulifera solaris]|uniref:Secreted protein n=1 Tax=Fistulifera solaris TaxID=1519565 RepID=A0A1Z5K5S8_FISSO|nr:hypothetical protein FisN_29Hu019 [Fistulifera solaris]|eukprot:GAX21587.1 hypothetical protein FisN_29Hu019 [Fistulifera solaris]
MRHPVFLFEAALLLLLSSSFVQGEWDRHLDAPEALPSISPSEAPLPAASTPPSAAPTKSRAPSTAPSKAPSKAPSTAPSTDEDDTGCDRFICCDWFN